MGQSVFDPNKCEIPVRVFNVSDTPPNHLQKYGYDRVRDR